MSELSGWSPWMKGVAVSLGYDESLFTEDKIEVPTCLVCQEPIDGEVTKIEIDEPNGLAGVKSTVSLCDEHSNVHPRIIRKRLEDYYA